MRQGLQSPDTVTFVAATDAETDAQVVGFSTLQGKEVRAVYVRPEVQGQGVGSDLLGAVETETKAEGIRKLEVSASLNSVGFYEAHGYERVGKSAVERGEGLGMRCIICRSSGGKPCAPGFSVVELSPFVLCFPIRPALSEAAWSSTGAVIIFIIA